MSHRARILKVLSHKDSARLPRTVLEGLARTDQDRKAAPALIDYMLALGELKMFGERRGTTYGLAKRRV